MTAILYCTKRHLPFHSHGVRVSCVSERVNIDSIIRILDLANSRGAIRGCLLCARTHRFKGSRLPLPLRVHRFAAVLRASLAHFGSFTQQKNTAPGALTNPPQCYKIKSEEIFHDYI